METTTTSVDTLAVDTDTTTAQAANNTSTDAQAADVKETISIEEARKLRSEAQNLRKRLKGYEDQEKQAQEAALSDIDKATKRATAAEAQVQVYRQKLVTAHVKMAAQSRGIVDPDIAALAVQDKLEFDNDGMPSNLEKALDELIKNKPYLVAAKNETPPPSPAQTARTPMLPAMNPGRASIQTPNTTLKPGQIPRLSDVFRRQ